MSEAGAERRDIRRFSNFPVTRFEVRFSDLDASGHLNHAAILVYLEQARVRYYRDVMGVRVPEGLGSWALKRIEVDYHSPGWFGDTLDLYLRIPWMGRSSAGWEFLVLRSESHGTMIAEGTAVHVHLDSTTGRPVRIPFEYRAQVSRLEGIPMCAS